MGSVKKKKNNEIRVVLRALSGIGVWKLFWLKTMTYLYEQESFIKRLHKMKGT